MDALHLSYDEVVSIIPYRNLLIMQKDKGHPCYGTKVVKMKGKDFAERRKARMAARKAPTTEPDK